MAQEGDIENALMGFPVCSDNPCTVNRKYNMQILHTHIMHDLVIRSL